MKISLGFGLIISLMILLLPEAKAAEDRFHMELLTIDPGEVLFARWGHNALRVRDRQKGTDRVYNYGTYDADDPLIATKYLEAQLDYWLSVDTFQATLDHYRLQSRNIHCQVLNLGQDGSLALHRALEENYKPENRAYRYDHFFENCSTRLRDLIDRVIGGRLKAATRGRKSGLSFRDDFHSAMADYTLGYYGLDIIMNRRSDHIMDQWEMMYLPAHLRNILRRIELPGPGGKARPLVSREYTMIHRKVAPGKALPPRLKFWLWILPLLLFFFLPFILRPRFRPGRWLAGFGLGLMGLIQGGLGCLIAVLWLISSQADIHSNENILFLCPLHLAYVLFGISLIGRARWAKRALFFYALFALALAALAALFHITGLFKQNVPDLLIAANLTALAAVVTGYTCRRRLLSREK